MWGPLIPELAEVLTGLPGSFLIADPCVCGPSDPRRVGKSTLAESFLEEKEAE